jgi:phosphoglycolate phosphatase
MQTLIVFDLDGTLVDSERDLGDSTNEMLESYGARPLPIEQVVGFVGEGARVLVRRALAACGLHVDESDALDRFRSIYDRRLLIHTRPYPGIEDIVARASRASTLAVLTNKPEVPARRMLDAFGLTRLFAAVIGGDGGFPRKPDPAGLQALAAGCGAALAGRLMVGDSTIDIESAENAGTGMCVAMYGFGNALGELSLQGDELIAQTPAGVEQAIEEFLRAAATRAS